MMLRSRPGPYSGSGQLGHLVVRDGGKGYLNTHWGWKPPDSDEFRHIYHNVDLVRICFPDELPVHEVAGHGRLVRLVVESKAKSC